MGTGLLKNEYGYGTGTDKFLKYGTGTQPVRIDIETWVRSTEDVQTNLDFKVRVRIRTRSRTPEYGIYITYIPTKYKEI